MERLLITGQVPLRGEIDVHGAKNSSLPLLAATVLCHGETVLHNCPELSDVTAACEILSYLGCKVRREGRTVAVDARNLSGGSVPDSLMREMRSSIVFLGAIAARMGYAKLSFPGGCELGPRPIDLHLHALRKLGLSIREEHGVLDCTVSGRMQGANLTLSFPSVGATENILLAAATAEGTTVLTNAAREPEIADLADFLNRCGAKIRGAGEGVITVEGVDRLEACEHTVIPDRIVAATYLCCAAATGGDVRMAQYRLNRELAALYAQKARQARYRGLFCVVSDPVDPLCRAALLESNRDEKGNLDGLGLFPHQVRGFGLGVMNARAVYYAKKDPRFTDFLTDGRSFGPHGEDLVLANSVSDYDDALSRELTEKVAHANLEMRRMGFKPYVAPAFSSGAT